MYLQQTFGCITSSSAVKESSTADQDSQPLFCASRTGLSVIPHTGYVFLSPAKKKIEASDQFFSHCSLILWRASGIDY